MAGARLTIRVDDAALKRGLKALAAAGADLTPAMEDIGAALLFATQRRFEAEAGPGDAPWAPFAASTLARMSPRRQPPHLLRDTLRLYGSLTYLADSAAVQVGTNVIYGGIHQFGGDVHIGPHQRTATFRIASQGAGRTADGRRVGSRLRFAKASTRAKSAHQRGFSVGPHSVHIPARPYLGFDDADQATVLTILADHLQQARSAA